MGRTLLPAALVTAVALAAAPASFAKGTLQVCGESGCAALGAETETPTWLGGGSPAAVASPAPAPYFVLRFGDVGGTVAYWIPSASIMRRFQGGPAVWTASGPDEQAALLRLTEGLQPYAAPIRAAAAVEGKSVRRGETYLRLYRIGTPVASPPRSANWIGIWLHGGTSPWTDGMSVFWVSKQGNLLKRDGQFLRIPPEIANRIRAHLPLT
jgi:hypothetical protein